MKITELQLRAYAKANEMTPVQAALHIINTPTPLESHPDFNIYNCTKIMLIEKLKAEVRNLEKAITDKKTADSKLLDDVRKLVNKPLWISVDNSLMDEITAYKRIEEADRYFTRMHFVYPNVLKSHFEKQKS
ncbi:hypothetical protein [Thalassolituus oleivorans]|uniref:hypothetical protein n=1 Tax=Thalassolituus oleivorans TaxID=187493 RepID=UPI0023F1D747|nr:hypothetical protein [Thalassolituus oleivorans]